MSGAFCQTITAPYCSREWTAGEQTVGMMGVRRCVAETLTALFPPPQLFIRSDWTPVAAISYVDFIKSRFSFSTFQHIRLHYIIGQVMGSVFTSTLAPALLKCSVFGVHRTLAHCLSTLETNSRMKSWISTHSHKLLVVWMLTPITVNELPCYWLCLYGFKLLGVNNEVLERKSHTVEYRWSWAHIWINATQLGCIKYACETKQVYKLPSGLESKCFKVFKCVLKSSTGLEKQASLDKSLNAGLSQNWNREVAVNI